jgi:acetylornithine deacetylase
MSAEELVRSLVAIDSVNPELVPGGAGETEIARFVADWLRDAGLDVELDEAAPGRPSVIAVAPGTGGGRSLMLNAHLDTVGVEGMERPFEPVVRDRRLYGRGAYDMKAGLAAALVACRDAAGHRLAGDVVVAAVADEEHASIGVQEVLATVHADAAVVTEPTGLGVVVAHKGFVWSEIEVSGRAAHGSRPDLGVDAIVKTGPVLTAIGALDAALTSRAHPLAGRASVHASMIRGGEELSSYPARCVVGVERRTLPGETAADVETELGSVLDECRASDEGLEAAQRTLLVRPPFEVAEDAAIVELVRDAAAPELGAPPPIGGAGYWTDAAFIASAGIPSVLFGPGGAGAHASEEWVSISETETVARTLVDVARRLCA